MDLQNAYFKWLWCNNTNSWIWQNIPIVALTAAAMIEDKEKVLKFGMNDHLSKPINSSELYNTIIKYSKK